MRAWLVGLVLCSGLACDGCREKPVDPACVALLAKIDRCDATAKDMSASYRHDLERSCGKAQKVCAAKDVSTPEACTAFMGCLYDGD